MMKTEELIVMKTKKLIIMKIKSLVTIKAKDMMRLILIIMKQLHDKNMEKSLDMNQFKLEKAFYKTGSQKWLRLKMKWIIFQIIASLL